MAVWELSFSIQEFVFDFTIIGALLIAGTVARARLTWLQRYLIPSNLVAGFAGLIIGPELLGWIDFEPERMGVYVYHLLALTFIGVGLRHTGGRSVGAIHIGFIKVLTYILQALIGIGVALLFLWLISPELVPAVGMLLPLGFGMGPGIAFSIGKSWEAYGFPEAASIGLTLAAIGFIVAYFTGMFVVNRGIRLGQTAHVSKSRARAIETGVVGSEDAAVGSRLTFYSGAIDTLSFHFALIGAIYLLSYGVTVALAKGMTFVGLEAELPTLWSLNFVVANLTALAVRKTMDWRGYARVLDEGTVNRLTGFLADLLVTSAIMAISLGIAWHYLGPIVVMSGLGALATYYAVKWGMSRGFEAYQFERTVGLYAEQTGTISSGLALIRVTDPEFVTPVAQDQVLGSGAALAIGFPLLLVINLPLARYSGQLEGYGVVAALLVIYLIVVFGLWTLFRKRSLRPAGETSSSGPVRPSG
ncbi:MAG: hypothetical protein KJO98_09475 [Rhodothermia bacterium]|nr:hypothetical protein [Rhodothermia bacterium]